MGAAQIEIQAKKIFHGFLENIYSSMVPNVCPGKEYKRRRIFISERELSLSEVVGKKDKMSNRAERLSGRAKRGQTAERS